MSDNFQQQLIAEAEAMLEPVSAAALNPWRREGLLASLGWDLAAVSGMSGAELKAWLDSCSRALAGVADLVNRPPESLEDLGRALDTVDAAVAAVNGLPPTLAGLDPQIVPPEVLAADLVTYLAVSWLERRHPRAYHSAVLLGVAVPAYDAEPSKPMPATAAPIRLGRARPELRLGQVVDLVRDPVGTLRMEYFPGGLETDAQAQQAAAKLFGRLALLLRELGVDALVAIDPRDPAGLDQGSVALASTMLTLRAPVGAGPARGEIGVTLALSSAQSGGLGLVVVPRGKLGFTHMAGSWALSLTAAAAGAGFAISKDGLTLPAGISAEVDLALDAVKVADPGEPAVRIGTATGTRLEVGALRAGAAAHFGGGRDDFGAMVDVDSAAIVVAAGDGDGFLAQVLPREGLRAEFELGAGWSSRTGLHFRGAASLEATLPVHATLGPLSVPTVFLALRAGEQGIDLALAATAGVSLGPVQATVERIGLEAAITFPEAGGNLGPAQFELDFKPPDGAGLVVEAGPLTGGGYLFFDPANQQYAGVLQLEFKGIALKAAGIITTRLPDGSEGFSLLLIISAEFTPVQLGFGFTLSGVGGLVGVNRTVALDVLRAGLKARTLDSIMFPRDPVANAPQLISNLSAVFPPAPGRFVIGPMARLGWGTPTLLTLDLGLILELPAPVRLAVLGRLRMALPREEAALVVINMDVLGIIDFERGEASVDATLYDSRIAGFALTGDMAMRAGWLDRPGFALSVGGFHPRFQPPPNFPALERLALTLCTGDNPRLRLEAYLALTSNTAQFGARLELYVSALGFSVEGMLAFDALFQFTPFSMLIEISGSLALKMGTRKLMGITVHLALSGPAPWHARGRARFEILFLSIEISFDVRFGAAAPPALPEPIAVEGLVEAALKDPRSWSAQLPPEGESLVTLREIPRANGELLIHPLGTLAVSQQVAPLGRQLERFGTARIAGPSRMDISHLRVGRDVVLTDPIEEQFAPAQFLELTDDQKLARPSFERWEAGRRVQARGLARDSAPPFEAILDPETIIIDDPDRPARSAGRSSPDAAELLRLVGTGAAAAADVRATGPARFAGPELELAVHQ